jgi:hypothetical protein
MNLFNSSSAPSTLSDFPWGGYSTGSAPLSCGDRCDPLGLIRSERGVTGTTTSLWVHQRVLAPVLGRARFAVKCTKILIKRIPIPALDADA